MFSLKEKEMKYLNFHRKMSTWNSVQCKISHQNKKKSKYFLSLTNLGEFIASKSTLQKFCRVNEYIGKNFLSMSMKKIREATRESKIKNLSC